jgi:hypothetical protein
LRNAWSDFKTFQRKLFPSRICQFFKVGRELLEWADEQESEELQISELIEQILGPDSLVVQKIKLETAESLERGFQAISDSTEFTQAQKETIFKTIAGKNGND